ncbi:putative LTP1-protein-tyrosine-phosphatase [Testicularia cyperi]|uniref:Putative LTP1-protein-tyrosine-phosphatase n=1 Tax=Testicularia cyperi TaxID=1882483 RepID=A0A317XX90_9BASI|nr:putative LTP1-protein-tyrosine-phosphatase [Testicularia cyperi]
MAAKDNEKINVLFCCLGNICRSPMALAVFEDTAKKAGVRDKFDILDSCGTGNYHEGEEPDERTTALLRKRNIWYDENNFARGVRDADFSRFDYIFGMDVNNVRNLKTMAPRGSTAKVYLFGEFDDGKPIADPYYSGGNGFEVTYKQCLRYSHAFLSHLGLGAQAKS